MLLSSSAFKLYSRHCEAGDIDNAIKEIDMFLEGMNDSELNYCDEMTVYNTHIYVHMPSDCIKHGPSANFIADGYEDQLRQYKKGSISHNIRVESFAQRAILKSILGLNEVVKKSGEKFKLD